MPRLYARRFANRPTATSTPKAVSADPATGLAAAPPWVQRCGIDSSCGCDLAQQMAGVGRDIQRAAADGGTPLPDGVRGHMEHAFGSDFSAVRVHTGPTAHHLASGLRARAFTSGSDLFFRSGAYQPATPAGDRLLAHELAHVVQQAGHPQRAAIDAGAADPQEAAAEAAAEQAVSSERVSEEATGQQTRAPAVQRQLTRERPPDAPKRLPPPDVTGSLPTPPPSMLAAWFAPILSDLPRFRRIFSELRYGCWCGPGYVCAETIDDIDKACKAHDLAYLDARISSAKEPAPGEVSMWSSKGFLRTVGPDLELDQRVTATLFDPHFYGPAAAVYRAGVHLIFGQFRPAVAALLQAYPAVSWEIVDGLPVVRIDIGDIPLLSGATAPLVQLPPQRMKIPLLAAGAALGPLLVAGEVDLDLTATSQGAVTLTPGMLRNVLITLDPRAGSYVGSGQLDLGVQLNEAADLGAAIGARAAVVLLLGGSSIRFEAGVQGGLRLRLHGAGAGRLHEGVRLGYESGGPFFDDDVRLAVGALVGAELSGSFQVDLYDVPVCQYQWPHWQWQRSGGRLFDLPLTLGYRNGRLTASAGLTSSMIPFETLGMDVAGARPLQRCKSLDELTAELCRRGILPATLCPAHPPTAGPSRARPTTKAPPTVGPGPLEAASGHGDCGPGQTPRVEKIKIEKSDYDVLPITIKDNRAKHTRNITASGDHTCDVEFLASVAQDEPSGYGPGLTAWIEAVEAKDTHDYGSQLGSDTAEKETYIELVKETLQEGTWKPGAKRYYYDAGRPVGTEVTDDGKVTSKLRLEGVPNQTHIVPVKEIPAG
jgi:hypothetical protein